MAIGALVIIATFYIWGMYGKLFLSSSKDQTNEQGFARLNYAIKDLLTDQKKITVDFPMSLKEGAVIIGFNKEKSVVQTCPGEGNVPKPTECKDYACICMYKDEPKKENLFKCEMYPQVDYFTTIDYDLSKRGINEDYFGDKVPKKQVMDNFRGQFFYDMNNYFPSYGNPNDVYAYFVLYGECNDGGQDEELGLQNFYIERFIKDQKVIIFINYASEFNKERISTT
jgi:ferredoxin-thioredoxin reductase catalytic subunit